jgi:hypothetical protein
MASLLLSYQFDSPNDKKTLLLLLYSVFVSSVLAQIFSIKFRLQMFSIYILQQETVFWNLTIHRLLLFLVFHKYER